MLDIEAEIVPGGRGQFDVSLDGNLLFSKQTEQRFPEDEEIIEAIRPRTV